MLSRLPCTSYQSQGETLNTSTDYNSVWESPRKTQCSQCFAHIEKRQRKISLNSRVSPPWPMGVSPCSPHRAMYLCTPLLCCHRTTLFPAQRTGVTVGLAKYHTMHMLQAETKSNHEAWNRERHSHKVIHPAQAVWALHLLVNWVFQAHSLFLQSQVRV